MTTSDANSEFQYEIWVYLNTEHPKQGYTEYFTGTLLLRKKSKEKKFPLFFWSVFLKKALSVLAL